MHSCTKPPPQSPQTRNQPSQRHNSLKHEEGYQAGDEWSCALFPSSGGQGPDRKAVSLSNIVSKPSWSVTASDVTHKSQISDRYLDLNFQICTWRSWTAHRPTLLCYVRHWETLLCFVRHWENFMWVRWGCEPHMVGHGGHRSHLLAASGTRSRK